MSTKFGDFVREKRLEKGYTLRAFSKMLEYSPGFWSDVENGRRTPPGIDKLKQIVEILELDTTESDILYDTAGDGSTNKLPPDLADIVQDTQVRKALRVARDKAGQNDWKTFIESLERK